jgi:hypothetical protein
MLRMRTLRREHSVRRGRTAIHARIASSRSVPNRPAEHRRREASAYCGTEAATLGNAIGSFANAIGGVVHEVLARRDQRTIRRDQRTINRRPSVVNETRLEPGDQGRRARPGRAAGPDRHCRECEPARDSTPRPQAPARRRAQPHGASTHIGDRGFGLRPRAFDISCLRRPTSIFEQMPHRMKMPPSNLALCVLLAGAPSRSLGIHSSTTANARTDQ